MLKAVLDEYVSRRHREHSRREVALSVAIAVTLAGAALVGVFDLWLPVIPGTPGLLVLKRRHAGTSP